MEKRTDGVISGKVTDPQGKAMAGVRVSVLGHEPEGSLTDPEGHFKLKTYATPGEEVRVTAESGNLGWTGYLPTGESVEIRLKKRSK